MRNMKNEKLPKSWIDYYKVANACVLQVARDKKISIYDAENIVLKVVEEQGNMLLAGNVKAASASLQMMFMNREVKSFNLKELV